MLVRLLDHVGPGAGLWRMCLSLFVGKERKGPEHQRKDNLNAWLHGSSSSGMYMSQGRMRPMHPALHGVDLHLGLFAYLGLLPLLRLDGDGLALGLFRLRQV